MIRVRAEKSTEQMDRVSKHLNKERSEAHGLQDTYIYRVDRKGRSLNGEQ